VVLFVLIGSAGPSFDTSSQSIGDAVTVNANRLSFFSLCLSAPLAWAASASDFFVYYPEKTPRVWVFGMSLLGLTAAFSFVYAMGVGMATGALNNSDWAASYKVSSGALLAAGYDSLSGFGKVCGVLNAIGVIANNIPGTYAAALDCQMLGRYGARVPRYLLSTLIAAIFFTCAIAGRDHLFEIFENFLALMGYWITFLIVIVLEEHLIYRKKKEYDWTIWNDRTKLPTGIAALIAFLGGWAGAILSMNQVYYVGVIARKIGDDGIDLGIWIGGGFTMILYPPLRYIELKMIGR
jgi:purine-cytosine permease-like protein